MIEDHDVFVMTREFRLLLYQFVHVCWALFNGAYEYRNHRNHRNYRNYVRIS